MVLLYSSYFQLVYDVTSDHMTQRNILEGNCQLAREKLGSLVRVSCINQCLPGFLVISQIPSYSGNCEPIAEPQELRTKELKGKVRLSGQIGLWYLSQQR